uniref:Uncharacterized protein n=1 Tax=Kwoniella bestiolae CBS 10118 TaxID=1296100 RepID=A0A1B9GEM1_9TREE|nr:hypothetical protein I302_00953 [Kwoniella bestiolae CBS 10118]OCF29448.1 hypothetical protein I302_00953 [Kwoniella bestiolae CBS 10118]
MYQVTINQDSRASRRAGTSLKRQACDACHDNHTRCNKPKNSSSKCTYTRKAKKRGPRPIGRVDAPHAAERSTNDGRHEEESGIALQARENQSQTNSSLGGIHAANQVDPVLLFQTPSSQNREYWESGGAYSRWEWRRSAGNVDMSGGNATTAQHQVDLPTGVNETFSGSGVESNTDPVDLNTQFLSTEEASGHTLTGEDADLCWNDYVYDS